MSRDVLTVADLTIAQVRRVFALAAQCKRARRPHAQALAGNTLALVFQKPSVRTRVSFEVAIRQLGGWALYLGPDDIQLGEREPIKDVARTLSRYVEGIVARTFRHADMEEFARYASVPVINGLSDLHHPCQALADLFTVQERFGRLAGLTIGYIGDGNNVLHSLAQAASLFGVHLAVATPNGYRPHQAIWHQAVRQARAHRARLVWSQDPRAAASSADVLYTDVWTSMGQERERAVRGKVFRAFQITERLVRVAKPHCVVMHCLPAHRGQEIAESVLEGPQSIVFDQAENRLHVQKALLLMLLARKTPR